MAYLDVAGMQMKYMTSYNEYITGIISAVIVYFSAFSLLFSQVLNGKIKLFKKKADKAIELRTITDSNVKETELKEDNE